MLWAEEISPCPSGAAAAGACGGEVVAAASEEEGLPRLRELFSADLGGGGTAGAGGGCRMGGARASPPAGVALRRVLCIEIQPQIIRIKTSHPAASI
jgi:hypothetical protein